MKRQVPNGYKKVSANLSLRLVDGLNALARKHVTTFSRELERAVKLYLEEKGEQQTRNPDRR